MQSVQIKLNTGKKIPKEPKNLHRPPFSGSNI